MNFFKTFLATKETWAIAFDYWCLLMVPHLTQVNWQFDEFDEKQSRYWFWEALNNFGGVLDDARVHG